MKVQEVRDARLTLEAKITALLQEFEEETDTSIKHVRLSREWAEWGRGKIVKTELEVII